MNAKQLADKFGMLSTDEIDLLQRCVKLLPASPVVVNIGANIGTSTCAILEANQGAFVFSVDLKPWPEEKENVLACGLDSKRVVRLLGNSAKIGVHFPYQPDMVFVDGGHGDGAVQGDIVAWIPKCKHVALFHDYHHPRYAKKPGVHLDEIVDGAMTRWERIGEARYLVAFMRPK
jgi:precorrin-6B methylase 2